MENEEQPQMNQPVPEAQEQMAQDGQYQDYGQEEYYEGEVSGALVATRVNKKKAAEDAKLLANRIALLKLEEKKAWKKIQETKRKAEQVMKVRQRNDEDKARKDDLRRQREFEEEQRLIANNQHKQNQRAAIYQNLQEKQMRQINEAQRLKQETQKNEQIIALQKEQEYMKNNSIKEMIRQQKMEAEERKQMELAQKRLNQRNKLINDILEENNRRMEIEAKVAMFEKEEYELIQRLQNTSNIQKQAYDDLESALNGNMAPEQMEEFLKMNPQHKQMASTAKSNFRK